MKYISKNQKLEHLNIGHEVLSQNQSELE